MIEQQHMLGEDRQGEVLELNKGDQAPKQKHFYIESYGCAMNFSDSEIVASVLADTGYGSTREMDQADLILINTCSIREKAEYNAVSYTHLTQPTKA